MSANPANLLVSDAELAQRIWALIAEGGSAEDRICSVSRRLLGTAYHESPLCGPAGPEELIVSLSGFDCVTYVETVLAIALSSSLDGFLHLLAALRYEGGKVSWAARNHYMTEWIKNNERLGIIHSLSFPIAERVCRVLDAVAGLPERAIVLQFLPAAGVSDMMHCFESGDLCCFVSAKQQLDVFHVGLLVRDGDSVLLRHASRRRGRVVDEPLNDFLSSNESLGLILARPVAAEFAEFD